DRMRRSESSDYLRLAFEPPPRVVRDPGLGCPNQLDLRRTSKQAMAWLPPLAHAALAKSVDQTIAPQLAGAADLRAERIHDPRVHVGQDHHEDVREAECEKDPQAILRRRCLGEY